MMRRWRGCSRSSCVRRIDFVNRTSIHAGTEPHERRSRAGLSTPWSSTSRAKERRCHPERKKEGARALFLLKKEGTAPAAARKKEGASQKERKVPEHFFS